MKSEIRKIEKKDLEIIKEIIDMNEMFPSEMLDGMIFDFFENPQTTDIWLTKEINDQAVIVAYCAPERMTEGTYNLYLIAVHKDHQSKGIGAEMMAYIEKMLSEMGVRILLVETSGMDEFDRTRAFYDKCDYQREAVIREFYSAGDDKVVFWKKLN